jgi:hypothetical protein
MTSISHSIRTCSTRLPARTAIAGWSWWAAQGSTSALGRHAGGGTAFASQILAFRACRRRDGARADHRRGASGGTKHRLQATEHLVFDVSVPPLENGTTLTTVRLLDDSSGTSVELSTSLWRGPTTEERSFAYTVCPGRLIVLRPATAPTAMVNRDGASSSMRITPTHRASILHRIRRAASSPIITGVYVVG